MAAPNPEKPPIPQEQPQQPFQQQPQQQPYYPPPPASGPPPPDVNVSNIPDQQYYPPPPPGGPPGQPHPLQAHPPAAPAPAYAIPAYDPAHPQFAPPPADYVPFDGAATSPQGDNHHKPPPSPVAATTPTTPSKTHGGWSERLHHMGMKAADPINALANKMGSQSFLPMALDKECEKAAVILSSFCKEGVETELVGDKVSDRPQSSHDKHDKKDKHDKHDRHDRKEKEKEKPRQKAILTIPPRVIQKAHGLAIFTVARVGFQISAATGSGIVVARRDDGAWSPPSGIQVHSLGAGFMAGADIYDCVCVLNSKEALDAFMNTRVSLGSDLAVVAGPYGAGGAIAIGKATASEKPDGTNRHGEASGPLNEEGKLKADAEKPGHKRSSSRNSLKPVFSYVKSRGLYAGISIDGTVITERKEANAAFYGQQVSVPQILRAEVPDRWGAIRSLGVALSNAQQGKSDMPEVAAPVPGQPLQPAYVSSPYQPAPTGPGAYQPAPGQAPYGQAPYGQAPYGQTPYGQTPYQQAPPQQQQSQNVPGVVSAPLQRVEQTAQHDPNAPPPVYVDDGKDHGTGDQKVSYQ